MQGDSFYRFSTVKKFVERNNGKSIRIIVDIGANVGNTLLLLHENFPAARIIGYEPVREYFEIATARTSKIEQIELHNNAVTAQHLFFDDLGERPRPCRMNLTIVEALPESGPGWQGGSLVGPEDHELLAGGAQSIPGYRRSSQPVTPVTLGEILTQQAIDEIDLLKLDCEGCEHSLLGCTDLDTLRRVRFITGEYHGLSRFYEVMRKRLFLTHKVGLEGNSIQGAFFAERRDGERDGILRNDKTETRVGTAPGQLIEWNPYKNPYKRFSWFSRQRGVHEARDLSDPRPGGLR